LDKCKKFLKENILLVITIAFSCVLLFLLKENFPKVVVLEILIWSWYILGKAKKNFTSISFLLILFVLPFNLSIQLSFPGIDPYVNGVFTNYLVPVIHILDMAIGIFLISALLEKKIRKKDFSIPMLLLLFLGILQLFTGGISSLVGIFRILIYLFCFKIVIREVDLKRDRQIGLIVKGLVLIQVIVALLQFVKGSSIGISFLGESIFSAGMKGSNFIDISGNLYIRGYGTFPHPNVLGGWLILMLTILWQRKDGLIFLLIASFGILLTFSRVAIFLMVLFWIFLIFEYLKEKKKIKMFSFFPLVKERVLRLFSSGDMAVEDRLNLLRVSFPIFISNWLLGVGYGNFVKEMGSNMPKTANGVWLNQPVHNVLALIFCELGILGGIVLGYGYWDVFGKKGFKIDILRKGFVLIALVVIGMVDHYLFSLPQGLIMGMLLLSIF
jgi:hypothetical protein